MRTVGQKQAFNAVALLALLILAFFIGYGLFKLLEGKTPDRACLEEKAREVCKNTFSSYIENSVDVNKERYLCLKNSQDKVEYFTIAEVKSCK